MLGNESPPNTPTPGLTASGSIGYSAASMLLPSDIPNLCVRTEYCASQQGASTNSDTEADRYYWDRFDCIHPYEGTDRPYVEYTQPPEGGRVGRDQCTQTIFRTLSAWRAPWGQPSYIYWFNNHVDLEWGFEDGSHDELGLHWSAIREWEERPVEIRWVTSLLPSSYGNMVNARYMVTGGRYPRTPSDPNPLPVCQPSPPYPVNKYIDQGAEPPNGPFGVGTGGNAPGSTHGWPQWKVYKCTGAPGGYVARTTNAFLSTYQDQYDRGFGAASVQRKDGVLTGTFGHSWKVGNYSFNMVDMAGAAAACTPASGGPVSCIRELFFQFFESTGSHEESWTWSETRENAFSYESNF